MTGPEGGFSEEEVALAAENNMKICSLGPRILRCETAPLCALTAVLYASGALDRLSLIHISPQKERFLREVEQQLLRKELDAKLLEDGLIHIRWKEKPLCSVDRDGIVRFRPADITGPEVDRQLSLIHI